MRDDIAVIRFKVTMTMFLVIGVSMQALGILNTIFIGVFATIYESVRLTVNRQLHHKRDVGRSGP